MNPDGVPRGIYDIIYGGTPDIILGGISGGIFERTLDGIPGETPDGILGEISKDILDGIIGATPDEIPLGTPDEAGWPPNREKDGNLNPPGKSF